MVLVQVSRAKDRKRLSLTTVIFGRCLSLTSYHFPLSYGFPYYSLDLWSIRVTLPSVAFLLQRLFSPLLDHGFFFSDPVHLDNKFY